MLNLFVIAVALSQTNVAAQSSETERVAVGHDVTVAADETVESALAVGGNVRIEPNAVVRGDVVAVGGNIAIEDNAHIEGDVATVGGKLSVAPSATIRGDRVEMGSSLGLAGLVAGSAIPWAIIGVLWHLSRVVVMFALVMLVVMFVPERVRAVRAFLVEKTFVSAIAGFAALVAIAPLCILLVVTVVGIPLAPVAAIGFFCMLVVGVAVVSLWLGERLPLFAGRKTTLGAAALGFALISVIELVPFLGSALAFVAALIGGGAVLLSRFGTRRAALTSETLPATV